MGKIPVQDLAKMMGISNQDLVFKLRSIGVRVEGDNAHIDTDIISAILQGKKLPHPREVILRDEQPPGTAAQPRRAAPVPVRRPPPSPLRPNRPRTLIQRTDRIQTLPMVERPLLPSSVPHQAQAYAAEPQVAEVEMPQAPVAAAPPAASPPPLVTSRAGTPRATIISRPPPGSTYRPATPSSRPPAPGSRPMSPGSRPMSPGSRPSGPPGSRPPGPPGSRPGLPGSRPSSSAPDPRRVERRDAPAAPPPRGDDKDKKGKRPKKPGTLRAVPDEDLGAYLGSLRSIEEVEEVEDVGIASGRRRRRAERKEEADRGNGKVLQFREAAPSGPVMISEGMTVRDFAEKLGVKTKDLIKALFQRGILANINHVLDAELAQQLGSELGIETMVVSFEEEVQLKKELATGQELANRVTRAPVVTIMGHVDHGKTSLLDAIRSSKVAEGEHGGITQHIGAYQVRVGERSVVFLDTPGHEAFTMMRARGARATDIVVLVVAADDGVMPQTLEAINHARAAKVPIVVALNKIDKDNANPDRVKKQLSDNGLLIEEWGGETVLVPLSATKKEGITALLEMILLTADLRDLKASPEIPAQGTVLEARKDIGRGIVATVLVQNGTLSVGDLFVSGATWGRVRAMADDLGKRIPQVGPSTPVEVTGFGELPEAGDLFQVVEDEAKARSIADFRRQEQRRRDLAPSAGRLSLEQLFNRIEEGEIKELPVIVKADVQGSVEVLKDTIEKASGDKVKVRVIMASAGAISTNDVLLASASGAIIIGFNVRPERNASELADKEGVDIRLHTVIYELTDELRKAMVGLLEPTWEESVKGRAEVREIFKVPKAGMVAGCHVVEGVVPRNAQVRLLRDNVVVYDGRISSLKRFKDDASEVRAGFDCGISLDRFQDVKPGDIIEAYIKSEVAATL